jgi:hypothetical protein
MGTGGSGKSILLRHLLVGAIAAKDRLTVFFELRDLKSVPMASWGEFTKSFRTLDFPENTWVESIESCSLNRRFEELADEAPLSLI